jgi:hypothetical protein
LFADHTPAVQVHITKGRLSVFKKSQSPNASSSDRVHQQRSFALLYPAISRWSSIMAAGGSRTRWCVPEYGREAANAAAPLPQPSPGMIAECVGLAHMPRSASTHVEAATRIAVTDVM